MRRLALTVLAALLAVPAIAHEGLSTQASATLKLMFTPGGAFGFPGYAADPFTCNAQTRRATYYNTTSNTTFFCNGSAWTSLGGASLPVSDSTSIVGDNADPTKQLRFEVGGFTTGTVRVVTFTNADQTVAAIGNNQTFSGTNTFSNTIVLSGGTIIQVGTSSDNAIANQTASTPDIGALFTGTNANAWLLAERADSAFAFNHAATTHPSLFVHSTNQSTTEFTGYTFLGPNPSRNTVTVDGATTFAVTSAYIVLVCTGAETINTITGGLTGTLLYLENSDTECTIADDDDATAANAVDLTGAATNDVGAVAKVLTLLYNGTHWLQVTESDN